MNPGFGKFISFGLELRLIVSPERTLGTRTAARLNIWRWTWRLGSGGPSSAALNCAAKLRGFASKRRSLRRSTSSLERHQRRTPVEVPDRLGVELFKIALPLFLETLFPETFRVIDGWPPISCALDPRCRVVLVWARASRASLGWTDEGVCPYANWTDEGVCPYASFVSSANFLE